MKSVKEAEINQVLSSKQRGGKWILLDLNYKQKLLKWGQGEELPMAQVHLEGGLVLMTSSNSLIVILFLKLRQVLATLGPNALQKSEGKVFLQHHGLEPTRVHCPWNSLGKNTGVGNHSLLQGIFLTQGSNPCLLHCSRQIFFYHLSHQEAQLLCSRHLINCFE